MDSPASSSSSLSSSPRNFGSLQNSPSTTIPYSSPSEETRKRKREPSVLASSAACDIPRKQRRVLDYVRVSSLTYPKCQYAGYQPPFPETLEGDAVRDFLKEWKAPSGAHDHHIIFTLEQLTVYKPHDARKHATELTPLNRLGSGGGVDKLRFNGVLAYKTHKRYVQNVPFDCLTVEGYGDVDVDSVSAKICIQSHIGKNYSVWYNITTSAPEYQRYFLPFLWIADLGKHVFDFMLEREDTCLHDFRSAFSAWLCAQHTQGTNVGSWKAQYGKEDFRPAVTANAPYLWKEAYNLDKDVCRQFLWKEINPFGLSAIPMEVSHETRTVVTPFVYNCFKDMYFALVLKRISNLACIDSARQQRRSAMRLTPFASINTEAPTPEASSSIKEIRVGDVVCVRAEKDSKWKAPSSYWYAYVQNTLTDEAFQKRLEVLWLYEPTDTTLARGQYPFRNELFMSDNCCCGNEAIYASSVIRTVNVSWNCTDPAAAVADGCFIVRQKFRTEATLGAYDFVTLTSNDYMCKCKEEASDTAGVMQECPAGSDVLVWQSSRTERSGEEEEILDSASIVQWVPEKDEVKIRRYQRCKRDLHNGTAAPNQVAVGSQIDTVPAKHVIRGCLVKAFRSQDEVSFPYNAGGIGDAFYVLSEHTESTSTQSSTQGSCSFDVPKPKLRTLSLFSGGGNFDRGLEHGGAIEVRYAVDWNSTALHTFRANLPRPENTQFFLGSVDDYMSKAMRGSKQGNIATVGQISVICAGAPCVSFSTLQRDKKSPESLKNASLVAAVLAFVDFYTPYHLILENVLGIASTPKGEEDQNVFSQILCCLVAMGYQVQQFLMDALSQGSHQSRSRIFIVASAPGVTPLARPSHTHSFRRSEKRFQRRSIGRASNGLPFGRREDDITPFWCVTTEERISDLPYIGDSHVNICIPFPDHRNSMKLGEMDRSMISMVPKFPRGSTFMDAVAAGTVAARQVQAYAWRNIHRSGRKSRSWSRVFPDGSVGCLTTTIQPHDAFNGRVLHYDQDRLMTIMEARRAQDQILGLLRRVLP